MTEFKVPVSWYSEDGIRQHLIEIVSDPVWADGIFTTVVREFAMATHDKRPMSETALISSLKQLSFEAALECGLIERDDVTHELLYYYSPKKTSRARVKKGEPLVPVEERTKRLEAAFLTYPKRVSGSMGKTEGMRKAINKFKTEEELSKFERATIAYALQVSSGRIDRQFVWQWSTWVNTHWPDFVDSKVPNKNIPDEFDSLKNT